MLLARASTWLFRFSFQRPSVRRRTRVVLLLPCVSLSPFRSCVAFGRGSLREAGGGVNALLSIPLSPAARGPVASRTPVASRGTRALMRVPATVARHRSLEVVEAIRKLARICTDTDEPIAGYLNRNGSSTGRGNRWSEQRVTCVDSRAPRARRAGSSAHPPPARPSFHAAHRSDDRGDSAAAVEI